MFKVGSVFLAACNRPKDQIPSLALESWILKVLICDPLNIFSVPSLVTDHFNSFQEKVK